MSRSLIVASIVLHAALAAGLLSIRPPERHELVRITVRELNDEPPPPVEVPEPPPPVPEPEVAEPTPVPEAPTPPRPRAPEPADAEAAPAPAEAAPAPVADVPDFGIALSGSASGPGIAVPTGDPGGEVRPAGERRVRESRRALEPAAHVEEEASDGCAEEATRPRALSMPPPRYTDAARAAGLEGRVRVEIHVDAAGHVTDVRVLASLDPDLDAAALEAARGASFAPATRCGVAVDATFTVSIRFEL